MDTNPCPVSGSDDFFRSGVSRVTHGIFALSPSLSENLDRNPGSGKATCCAQTNCPTFWTSNKFDTFYDLSLVSSLKDAKNGG
jgi:hypothetical protein